MVASPPPPEPPHSLKPSAPFLPHRPKKSSFVLSHPLKQPSLSYKHNHLSSHNYCSSTTTHQPTSPPSSSINTTQPCQHHLPTHILTEDSRQPTHLLTSSPAPIIFFFYYLECLSQVGSILTNSYIF
ncbi:hypothetical protein Peur_073868 [Populus x canadensis]